MLIYGASKAAIISVSEALRDELEGSEVGVSVLLPSSIRSNIVASQRNRPTDAGRHHEQSVAPEQAAQFGLDPALVGTRVREGVERGEFYIFAMPEASLPGVRRSIEERAHAHARSPGSGRAARRRLRLRNLRACTKWATSRRAPAGWDASPGGRSRSDARLPRTRGIATRK